MSTIVMRLLSGGKDDDAIWIRSSSAANGRVALANTADARRDCTLRS